jgi:hypothetical protein
VTKLGYMDVANTGYWSAKYLFPIGYTCVLANQPSLADPDHKLCSYTQTILPHAIGRPVFQVQCNDLPDLYFQAWTPTDAWEYIESYYEQRFHITPSQKAYRDPTYGYERFGLLDVMIRHLLQSLPDINQCDGFQPDAALVGTPTFIKGTHILHVSHYRGRPGERPPADITQPPIAEKDDLTLHFADRSITFNDWDEYIQYVTTQAMAIAKQQRTAMTQGHARTQMRLELEAVVARGLAAQAALASIPNDNTTSASSGVIATSSSSSSSAAAPSVWQAQ